MRAQNAERSKERHIQSPSLSHPGSRISNHPVPLRAPGFPLPHSLVRGYKPVSSGPASTCRGVVAVGPSSREFGRIGAIA